MAYFPVAVFLGKIVGRDLVIGLVVQVGWVVFFMIASRLILKMGFKRYSGYGG
jgi:ABC-2 type transport system permease protein